MLNSALLDRRAHEEDLLFRAARALLAGRNYDAFCMADRLCRILPVIGLDVHLLRAEALYRLGRPDEALEDVREALAIEPEHRSVNRRMLSWGAGSEQLESARRLLTADAPAADLRAAFTRLKHERDPGWAALSRRGDRIFGWVAWRGPEAVDLSVETARGATRIPVTPVSDHPLAPFLGHAAGIRVEAHLSESVSLALELRGQTFHVARFGIFARAAPSDPEAIDRDGLLTVIVPVYDDFEATRACLQSLLSVGASRSPFRTIVVEDAAPDPRIRSYLRRLAADGSIILLVNERNFGFVGSVNRGLAMTSTADVVLLNADTVVPAGCLDRLAKAAGQEDVGTVTPLSNNGEFTSLPVPFRVNPLPGDAELAELDRLAAEVNAGRIVDLPNGIGFCLYVTRACLRAVGPLSTEIERGYLEDVDLCLRARLAGFRNVCATDVYVGHAGTRSFKQEKRALVVRNLGKIETRYPDHRRECAAFLAADPLRPARQTLEAAVQSDGPAHLIVGGGGLHGDTLIDRAVCDAPPDRRLLTLQVRFVGGRAEAHLRDPRGGYPQTLSFDLGQASGRDGLLAYLGGQAIEHVDIVDPAGLPLALKDAVEGLGAPIALTLADAGLLCPRSTFLLGDGTFCGVPEDPGVCDACIARSGARTGPLPEGVGTFRRSWRSTTSTALRVRTANERSAAFLARFLPDIAARAEASAGPGGLHLTHRPSPSSGDAPAIVMLSSGVNAQEHRLMLGLAREARARDLDTRFVVLGETLDDLALMACGNVFVSGAVADEDYARLLALHAPVAAIFPGRQAVFHHPAMAACEAAGVPRASFDWSFGSLAKRPGDLALDPGLPHDETSSALAAWVADAGLRSPG